MCCSRLRNCDIYSNSVIDSLDFIYAVGYTSVFKLRRLTLSRFKKILIALIIVWSLLLVFTAVYGRNTFVTFYSPQAQALDGEMLKLSLAYGRFLSLTGIPLAVLAALIVLILTRGKPLQMVSLFLLLITAGVYSLLPTYYSPGDSYQPWLFVMLIFLPVYVGVIWVGGWLWRLYRQCELNKEIRPYITTGIGALTSFTVLYLVIMYILQFL